MEVNLSTWGYYQPGFVDPLYVPYQRSKEVVSNSDGYTQLCEVNTWKKMGYPDGLVNPGLVRKGWGLSFQRKHGMDSCPAGWTSQMPNGNPGQDGWCYESVPEFEPQLYSKTAFIPRNQYWKGYTIPNKPGNKPLDSFDFKSVSPYTGKFVSHINSGCVNDSYNRFPVKNSYLG